MKAQQVKINTLDIIGYSRNKRNKHQTITEVNLKHYRSGGYSNQFTKDSDKIKK
jgi:translation elongation factor P/translation initiation factor 5A